MRVRPYRNLLCRRSLILSLLEEKKIKKPRNKFSHLGIGLFVVKKIVEAHSGTMNVSSTAEAGTTFVVSLPCHENEVG